MKKNILITGASDGLGFATAKLLLNKGHNVILHTKTKNKLAATISSLQSFTNNHLYGYSCDLSILHNITNLSAEIKDNNEKIDVLINNAGVFIVDTPITEDKLDIRFAVNTIAPYLLTTSIIDNITDSGRIINIASAAQTSVNIEALLGNITVSDDNAYAMSKLALIIWTNYLADKYKHSNKIFLSVNPKSFLSTKMVKQAYNMRGYDINIGANILVAAAIEDKFLSANGKYFDNDIEKFTTPHPDTLDKNKTYDVIQTIKYIIKEKSS